MTEKLYTEQEVLQREAQAVRSFAEKMVDDFITRYQEYSKSEFNSFYAQNDGKLQLILPRDERMRNMLQKSIDHLASEYGKE